ncbi:uncharacterized protein I206_105662 [Kwoniella pini CBS 10737]|uniref:HMG box domain-containing protein n=1 Tax=Kwoniella pini CBS 10737 TaxID=1296096 RepID=A0A1B9I3L1_9TREE|nr:uncharacterized protein I206_03436 [Kwoniella pini CBS 10737]OCF50119.1 hypothetical protein I206_03436 [Kwoniella pini CBS 10737]
MNNKSIERPQLSIEINHSNNLSSDSIHTFTSESPLYSASCTTPSSSLPTLSRDSIASIDSYSYSTRIQTPINNQQQASSSTSFYPPNTASSITSFQSEESYDSKMTTTNILSNHQPYSMPSDYNCNSTFNDPHSESQVLSHPYQLPIDYLQETTNHSAGTYEPSLSHAQHLGISGWAPMLSSFTINPQLMEATPSRSLSPESNATLSPEAIATEDIPVPRTIAPRMVIIKSASTTFSTDEWYDGPSVWIRSVAESHKQRREAYLANPKAWPKGEGEPKELQPLTDHCRFPHLWEVEQARKDLTEEAVVIKLMKKSEATISKEFARCQKAGEEFKPPRPMNSAMAFADFRRPQWGDMYTDMKTGSISTWLSAEWRALKDLRPEEFDWWTRVSKKYWDKYVEDYDYKFTRAPNGEGKGSKKRKAKAKENAAREKAIRLSNEAARRSSSRSINNGNRRSGNSRGSLAPPMNIILPEHQQHQQLHQFQPFGSPNVLGLSGLPQHHMTPTTNITPGGTSMPYNTTGYFDGYTFPSTEGSRTPSPPHLLTPLDATHSSHVHSPGYHPQQAYFYPTQAQINYAHHHAQQAQFQQQQQHQINPQHQQLQINICNTGTYFQPPSQTIMNNHEFFTHSQHHQQTPTQGINHHLTTLAPNNIPSPQ